jgi:single-stranded-DNA-specific exonuclease
VLANELDALNQTRKEIEQGMQAEALTLCQQLERRPEPFSVPSPVGAKAITGRWKRSLIREARMPTTPLYPGLILKFGGHAMAAGLSLEEARFEEFQQRFGELVTPFSVPSPVGAKAITGRWKRSLIREARMPTTPWCHCGW